MVLSLFFHLCYIRGELTRGRNMKLGTLKSKSLDGELVVVSRDGQRAVKVAEIAPDMRSAMDCWSEVEPLLKDKYEKAKRR